MSYQLKLTLDDLNKIKLSSLIDMADELNRLNSNEDKKYMGNPNEFRI